MIEKEKMRGGGGIAEEMMGGEKRGKEGEAGIGMCK